ncbi:hypothetical protein UF16_18890 [Chromobacterium violaceum]|nr:hypothetical protein UF16_18890 [Chromobacterium violaceum]
MSMIFAYFGLGVMCANSTLGQIPLLDTDDGSGDAILELPIKLLALTGWAEEDTLSFEDRGDSTLLVRKQ